MRKILALVLSLCMLCSLCAAAAYADDAALLEYELGDTVEDFTVELCDGTVVSLYEMLETKQLVMINVWATWCGPCKAEFPVMEEAYNMYSDVVGLVCLSPYDSNEDVAAFMEKQGLSLPMGYDSIGADGFVMEGYPTTIIIDRFGTYVMYECGSMLDVESFTGIWDKFLGDDYTESVVVYGGEEVSLSAYAPTPSDELTAALCADGSIVFESFEDEYVWPFIVEAGGVISSNVGENNSTCSMIASGSAAKGDVFAIDYAVDTEMGYDYVTVFVNEKEVKHLSSNLRGTFAYEFKKDNDFKIEFSFSKDEYDEGEYADYVFFCNARLVSGDEAQAILDAQPEYPLVLAAEDIEIDVLSESAKEIVFTDESGMFEEYYGGISFFIVPEDYGTFRGVLGSKLDPDSIWMYGDWEGNMILASQAETDEEGFIFETELSCVENGGYENTYIVVEDYVTGNYNMIVVFKNEENVNYFKAYYEENASEDGSVSISWEYADGTQPSTDEMAQIPGEMPYEIYFVDENGDPVDGVMVNVCTDETCTPAMTEGGYYAFDGEPFAYVIHVLKVPEGYEFDTSTEFVMNADGDVLVIEIPHA